MIDPELRQRIDRLRRRHTLAGFKRMFTERTHDGMFAAIGEDVCRRVLTGQFHIAVWIGYEILTNSRYSTVSLTEKKQQEAAAAL